MKGRESYHLAKSEEKFKKSSRVFTCMNFTKNFKYKIAIQF